MAVDLPKVNQDFSADVTAYVANLNTAIGTTKDFASAVGDAITKVNELNTALKTLPDMKTITIQMVGLDEAITKTATLKNQISDLPTVKTIFINEVVNQVQGTEVNGDVSAATQVVNQARGSEAGTTGVGTEIINQVPGTTLGGDTESTLTAMGLGLGEGGPSSSAAAAWDAVAAAEEGATAAAVKNAAAQTESGDALGYIVRETVDGVDSIREVTSSIGNENVELSSLARSLLNAINEGSEWRAQQASAADAAVSWAEAQHSVTDAINATGAATGDESPKVGYLTAQWDQMSDAQKNATISMGDQDDQLQMLSASINNNRTSMAGLNVQTKASNDNIIASTAILGAAAGFWTRWGTAIHWVVSGGAELLAVGVPALVAFGSAAFVALQGTQNAYERIYDLYSVLEGLGPALGKTAGDFLGLGHAGQAAQDAMQPQVYEALGGVLDALKTHIGNLATVGSEMITLFDTFLAKFDVEINGSFGGELTSLLSKAGADLMEFGQIFSNLGKAVLNFAADMPGLAEVLLKVLDVFSDFIKIISEIPAPIITVLMGMEEFFRWGSLLVLIFSKLVIGAGALVGVFAGGLGEAIKGAGVAAGEAGGSFGALFKLIMGSLVGVGGVTALIVAWSVVAVAALVAFSVYIMRAQSSMQEWIDSSDKMINSAPDYAQINDTIKTLGQNTAMTAQAQDTLNTKTSAWSALASGAQENVSALAAQHKQLTTDLLTETGDIAYISKAYGVSYTTAIAYATAAGVKLTTSMQGNSTSAQVARQMIANMITGYEAMGQAGTQITADINAVTVANSGQLKSVQSLNSAWTTVIGLASGMQTSFLTFEQGLNTISTDAKATGASFNGLNSQSLTLRQDFESNITNMASSLGSLNTALSFGGVSWNQYRQAIATEVEEMLHAGDLSAAQVAQLGQVASAAGYTGSSYGSLAKWAGQFGGSENQLNNTMSQATIAMANQNTLAGKLQGTLQTDVVDATASATLAQSGFQGALIKTQAAFQSSGAGSATFQKDLLSLDESMREAGVSQAAIVQENNILDGSNNTVSQGIAAQAEKVKGLSDTYTAAKTSANSWQDDIKNVMIAIGHYAEEYVDEFREDIVNGWNAVSSATVSTWDSIKSFLVGTWNSIAGTVTSTWNAIYRDIITPVINAVTEVKNYLGDSFDSWWKSHGMELEEVWTAVWETIKNTAETMAAGVEMAARDFWGFLETVWEAGTSIVSSKWDAMWSVLKSLAQEFWSGVEPIIELGWDLIKSFFTIAEGTVSAAWQVFWGFLEMAGKDSFDAIAAVLKVIWDTIVGIFDVALDLLTGHWHQAWVDALNTGKQDWNAISGFFKQAWNTFAGYASTTFHDIGSDIVGGLKNGILSAASSIGSFIKNNLVNPIINAVKSFFGIASPSTVMAGLGGNLVSGLLKGLEHSPDDLIKDVFGSWPSALAKILGKGLISVADLPESLISSLMKSASSLFDSIFGGGGAKGSSTPTGANAGVVISAIDQAIKDTGVPQSWFNDLAIIAAHESADNPNAINNTDSNAAAGDPSRGLMQTIMTTFEAYHQAGTSNNIYDPVANVAAAINYIKAVYGTVANVPGVRAVNSGGAYVGYDSGGLLMPGYTMAANLTGKPERIIPADQGMGSGDLHVHMQVGGQEIARAIFKDFQKEVFQYNARNGTGAAGITGAVRPGGGGGPAH